MQTLQPCSSWQTSCKTSPPSTSCGRGKALSSQQAAAEQGQGEGFSTSLSTFLPQAVRCLEAYRPLRQRVPGGLLSRDGGSDQRRGQGCGRAREAAGSQRQGSQGPTDSCVSPQGKRPAGAYSACTTHSLTRQHLLGLGRAAERETSGRSTETA